MDMKTSCSIITSGFKKDNRSTIFYFFPHKMYVKFDKNINKINNCCFFFDFEKQIDGCKANRIGFKQKRFDKSID